MEINKDFGYVYGVYLGDGYISYTGKDKLPNTLGLKVKDKDFVEYFKSIVMRWSGMKDMPIYNIVEGGYQVYRYRIFSREICEFILNFEMDTIPYLNKDICSNVLRGLYDSEGSVDTYEVHFCNTDERIINLTKNLLDLFGIRYSYQKRIMKKGGIIKGRPIKTKKVYMALRIINKRNMIKFKKYIGFTIARKQKRLEEATTHKSLVIDPKDVRITRNGLYRKGGNILNLCICGNFKPVYSKRCWDCYLKYGRDIRREERYPLSGNEI